MIVVCTTLEKGTEEEKAKAFSILQGNELTQLFVKNVYSYFKQCFTDLNAFQEAAKALKIYNTVRRYKDGPIGDRLVLTRKRPKSKTDDLRQGQRVEIRDEIYNMYAGQAWRIALEGVFREQRASYVRHTDEIIKATWEKERHISISDSQPIIINVDDSGVDFSDDDLK